MCIVNSVDIPAAIRSENQNLNIFAEMKRRNLSQRIRLFIKDHKYQDSIKIKDKSSDQLSLINYEFGDSRIQTDSKKEKKPKITAVFLGFKYLKSFV